MSSGSGFEIVTTTGGATAIRDAATGEVMHPVVGPLIEAQALYVEPSQIASRFARTEASTFRVLDVGLGAGSNAMAAIDAVAKQLSRSTMRLEIVSFDRTLEAMALASRHADRFAMSSLTRALANDVLTDGVAERDGVTWSFVSGELPSTLEVVGSNTADIVFWDPFSPKANPELWSVAAFAAARRTCRAGATLHTYSGATAVRSALALAGFAVGEGPATHAARTSTIAAVDVASLQCPLGSRWLARLRRSSAAWPSDAPVDAMVRVEAMAQFVSR